MDASSFFEEESSRLAGQGYGSRAFVLRGKRAYGFGFLCALPLIAALSAWYFSLSPRFLWAERWQDFLLFAALAVSAVPLHECMHALVWGLCCGFSRVRVRFSPPACSCLAQMGRVRYFLGAAAPFLILGLGFSAAALVTGGWAFYAAAALHILCAGADVLVCCFLPAARGILLDHPTECGFVCYSR